MTDSALPYFPCLPQISSHAINEVPDSSALRARSFDLWEPSGNPECDCSQEFRHSGWHRDRCRIYHALVSSGKSLNRLKRFCTCGQGAMIYQANNRRAREMISGGLDVAAYKAAAFRCHDRFCVPCERERSSRIRRDVLRAIGRRRIRMITLTVLAQGQGLRAAIKHALDSFKQLRRLKLWTRAVEGCIYVLEIKRNERTRWHVHIHALAAGSYIEVGWLSQAWHAITQDSQVVHVTLAHSPNGVAAYVAKYATKTISHDILTNDADLSEAITALHGVRMVNATGCFFNQVKDDADYVQLETADWEIVGTFSEVWAKAAGGDEAMRAVIAALRIRDPIDGTVPAWADTHTPPIVAPPDHQHLGGHFDATLTRG